MAHFMLQAAPLNVALLNETHQWGADYKDYKAISDKRLSSRAGI